MAASENAPLFLKAQVHLYHYPVPGGEPEFLLLQRTAGRDSLWQCVTGNVDPGEDVAQCALREVAEETAVALTGAATGTVWTYRFQKGERVFEEHVFGFEAADRTVVLSHEHQAFRWVPPRQALEMIHYDGIRQGLLQVLAALRVNPVQ